ncbi:MAG TPA: heme-binding domain-containing protein [Acidimicrobiales bacterium]|nr:heme-binding domain-containing protein [Acidimicrobiales bacterium]
MKAMVVRVLLGFVVVFALLQLVPNRVANPATRHEPPWDSPQTRQLAVTACFNCHSNQTHVAWFEQVAPLSWWIKSHVHDGRQALNFDEWQPGQGGGRAARAVQNGSMPPSYYTWVGMHSEAKLTPAQRQQLAQGLEATLGPGGADRRGRPDRGG